MKINELQAGDVLFTMLNQKAPALHTQMYIGDAQFPETIIHAVDDSKGPSKLMATGLKTDSILVYRCKNKPDLVRKAVKYGVKWTNYQTPYDQERKTLKEGYRNTIPDGTNMVALMRELFNNHGKFRAIKYTARRAEILCYPNESGGSKGLTCTMFVILCYQAAALSDCVRKTRDLYPGATMVRVSDKKMTKEDLKMLDGLAATMKISPADLQDYKTYLSSLQSGNEYKIDWELAAREPSTRPPSGPLPGYRYVPSILCWDHKLPITTFNFAGAMTDGFLVDAKITTSEQLRLCLEADNLGWENKGYMDPGEAVARDSEYKNKLADHNSFAETMRQGYVPKTPDSHNVLQL